LPERMTSARLGTWLCKSERQDIGRREGTFVWSAGIEVIFAVLWTGFSEVIIGFAYVALRLSCLHCFRAFEVCVRAALVMVFASRTVCVATGAFKGNTTCSDSKEAGDVVGVFDARFDTDCRAKAAHEYGSLKLWIFRVFRVYVCNMGFEIRVYDRRFLGVIGIEVVFFDASNELD
jgi:hypothetical protein